MDNFFHTKWTLLCLNICIQSEPFNLDLGLDLTVLVRTKKLPYGFSASDLCETQSQKKKKKKNSVTKGLICKNISHKFDVGEKTCYC